LCDGQLPACLQCDATWFPDRERFVREGPQADLCGQCHPPAARTYEELGIPLHRFSTLLSPGDVARAAQLARDTPSAALPTFRLDGLAVGEHALAGALRFFARATLESEPTADAVLRRYFRASLLSVFAIRALLARERYDVAVFHHGIYVPQGLAAEVLRAAGVRVVTWNPAYRKQCFIFSHGDTYHHTLMSEPTEGWESMPWDAAREEQITDYLKSRWYGTNDWIWFHERPQADLEAIASETGVDLTRPVIGLLTNVMWDAQLHYPANAFPNMLEWVLASIRHFAARPELQLLIRVHPAEIRGSIPSRQPIAEEIRRAFPQLPPNVFVIPPESQVSTYAAMEACDSVLIFGTKTGVELTSMGIPVICAGEAWIRNKGLTKDATSPAHYEQLLQALPVGARLDPETVRRARRYAYHFFFRRMIPLQMLVPAAGNPPFRLSLDGLAALEPGRNPGLDIVVEGILHGTEFVNDEPLPAPSPTGTQ
jgi:hypothetical protein